MNAPILNLYQQARKLPWSECVTLARANHALADIYIRAIRDDARQLAKNAPGNIRMEYVAIEAQANIVLDALESIEPDCAEDLIPYFEELDALVCDDDGVPEPLTRYERTYAPLGFVGEW